MSALYVLNTYRTFFLQYRVLFSITAILTLNVHKITSVFAMMVMKVMVTLASLRGNLAQQLIFVTSTLLAFIMTILGDMCVNVILVMKVMDISAKYPVSPDL